MNFDNIISSLSNDEVVVIADGEVMIKPKLKKIVGGMQVYEIMIDINRKDAKPIYLGSIDELDDFSICNKDGISLRRCSVCGDFAEHGYFVDHESLSEFCSIKCLSDFMNNVFGFGHWFADTDDFGSLLFFVESKQDDIEDDLLTIKRNDKRWRPYDIECIPKIL